MDDRANGRQDVARPWTAPGSAKPSKDELRARSAGVTNALAAVERIQSRIPSWQRFVTGVETDAQTSAETDAQASADTEAQNSPPDWHSIAQRLAGVTNHPDESLDGNRPHEILRTIAGRNKETKPQGDALTFSALLGIHAELLVVRLEEAQSSWDSAGKHAQVTARAESTAHAKAPARATASAAVPRAPEADPPGAAADDQGPAANHAAAAADDPAPAADHAGAAADDPAPAADHAGAAAEDPAPPANHAAAADDPAPPADHAGGAADDPARPPTTRERSPTIQQRPPRNPRPSKRFGQILLG